MAEYRRVLPIIVSASGLACAVIGLVHVFEWADVPGGRFFVLASGMLLTVAGLFIDVPSLWRRPKAPRR